MSEEKKTVSLTNVEMVKKSAMEFENNFAVLNNKYVKIFKSLGVTLDESSSIFPNNDPDKILLKVRKNIMELSAFAHSLIFTCNAFLESRKDWRA